MPGATSSAASSPAHCSRPRVPFRRFLARERYRVEAGAKLELTPAVVMRRMTKVSPYPYWHFFDAYPPGLPARGVPRQRHPAAVGQSGAGERPVSELGGVPHDRRRPRRRAARRSRCCATASARCCTAATRSACTTWPATRTCCRWAWTWRRRWPRTACDSAEIVEAIFRECLHRRGEARIPKAAAQALDAVANVLNIAWIEDALAQPGAHHLPAQQPLSAPGTLRGGAAVARARDRRRAPGNPRPRRLMA